MEQNGPPIPVRREHLILYFQNQSISISLIRFQGLLQDSRQQIDEKKLVKHKKELEIEGHR